MQPPPPPGSTPPGPPPPMPPQLQAMMRQMEKRQPKFQQQIQPPAPNQHQQGGRPSDDVRDASRFFLPSFLEDPEELRPRQVQYATNNGPGRVFFQPSFLEDPWAQLVH
ncbi:uncharacterized protein PITG_09603 [Phytophthora infestans T30-4]|uniref:Uncharacterized protein n=1 Tax=Phytophthora infestans (strain T30-4) TaxID=403677 RepID=D0NCD7_PHYIT|nr:uncharacterized protein PITG_09603 [Phytophthora infestans T30-4]EEY55651.1 conserved hypothetical protein [Phytophthora infestans T30-4]|eukprot:XP_002903227.1 conserved hypothetical protein [Phytophthora infestans T30-4]